ncbi:MAG: MlaD family protein [Bdellovibrionia bacterium]
MKKNIKSLEFKIGLFASMALGLILVAVWMLGSTHQLFSSKLTYYLSLPNAEGIAPGALVMIAGVRSGSVEDLALEPGQRRVRVVLSISAHDAESLRQDSLAQMTTHGVLGDKVITISAGDPSLPKLSPGSEIRAETTTTFSNLFGRRGDRVLESFEQVIRHLDQLLASTTKNGKMDKLMDALLLTSQNASTSAELLNDQLRGIKLKEAVNNLNSILAKADHGAGTVSGLINDPALYDNAKALVGEVNHNRIVRNLIRKSIQDSQGKEAESRSDSAAGTTADK